MKSEKVKEKVTSEYFSQKPEATGDFEDAT